MKIMNYPKLSEKTLKTCLEDVFKDIEIIPQKRFKGETQTFVVDYFIPTNRTIFEFDGPYHFCDTKTQLRDANLEAHCAENDLFLVRFPYFIQFDKRSFEILTNNRFNVNVGGSTFQHGFHDKKIVYPGNFNRNGIEIFEKIYTNFIRNDCWSIPKEIFESLHDTEKDTFITLGFDVPEFLRHYPT